MDQEFIYTTVSGQAESVISEKISQFSINQVTAVQSVSELM